MGREDNFDAVVVGSGFGGSLAAWRLQHECPQARILVLERGMPYPPRSFARTPREMRDSFWDPSSSLHGLFEVWSFEHVAAVVSSGLGGGSLIYASVLLEKPPQTFAADPSNGATAWPVGHDQLAGRYQQVKKMLGANQLPHTYRAASPAGTASVPKTEQFIAAAEAAGLTETRLAELGVTFAAPGEQPAPGAALGSDNLHHRERRTCTLAGECDLGCNEGAKNTLDYTYLSDFKRRGGEIRTCAEAVGIAPRARGYRVRYLQHLRARTHVEARARADGKLREDRELLDPSAAAVREVSGTIIVLAAGTFGSTRLLLMNRAALLPLSDQLGFRFSSNGDLLTFARDCSSPGDRSARDLAPSRGPVITAYAQGDELWMEDAGGPVLSAWGWQVPELPGDLWAMRHDLLRIALGRRRGRGRIGAALARMLGSTRSSSAMLPMLTMGRDIAGGRMRLEGESLSLDWDPDRESREYFNHAQRTAASVARQLGGKLGPRWLLARNRGLTVHPLGGCAMGADPSKGVVSPSGEVFGCPGLFVADGSVMPGPVGPNPSLTIAALADHIAQAAAGALKDSSG